MACPIYEWVMDYTLELWLVGNILVTTFLVITIVMRYQIYKDIVILAYYKSITMATMVIILIITMLHNYKWVLSTYVSPGLSAQVSLSRRRGKISVRTEMASPGTLFFAVDWGRMSFGQWESQDPKMEDIYIIYYNIYNILYNCRY